MSGEGKYKKSLTNIESLPEQLVFHILLHLRAEDIYHVARIVCKKWKNIIHSRHFIYAHLHHSTPGLLVQNFQQQENPNFDDASFVAMRKGRIEISKFRCKFRGLVSAGCNGLVIKYDGRTHHVINPVINKQFVIPKFSSIAYCAASMEYKVVRTYKFDAGDLSCVDILTIGVDKSWRHIPIQHLSPTTRATLNNNETQKIITEGFMHWVEEDTHVVTLNVETETIVQYPVPQGYQGRQKLCLSGGRSLSLFIADGNFAYDVWDMKSETGEWAKLCNIDLEDHWQEFDEMCTKERERMLFEYMLLPRGWLKPKEVLVMHVSHRTRSCIAYDIRTQEFQRFNVFGKEQDCNNCTFDVHTNSLVSLAGNRL